MRYMAATTTVMISMFLLLAGCQGLAQGDRGKGSPCDRSESYYRLAVGALQEGEMVRARQELFHAEELCPGNERVHNLAGLLDLQENKYDQAIARFTRALEIDPKYSDARHNMANVYMAKQDWPKARDLLLVVAEDMLYNYPYLVERNLGFVYYQLNEKEKAKEHLKKAVFIEDSMCRAWFDLGVIAREEGEREKALRYFENAVRPNKKAPNKSCDRFVKGYYELAVLYLEFHEQDKARESLKRCADLTQNVPDATMHVECAKMLRMFE